MEKQTSGSTNLKAYSQVIEPVRFYNNAIVQLQTQMDQAKIMVGFILLSIFVSKPNFFEVDG